MTKIISFANQKGGVGKTTSTINVASSLALDSHKVLVIDMDPQANLTQVLASTTDHDLSIYDLLIPSQHPQKNTITLNQVLTKTYLDNLDILPSNVLLSSAELDLVPLHSRETVLKRLLKTYKKDLESYDFILIDCQPSLGLLTINSIIASDHIMIPLHADVFSLTGLELLIQTVEKLQEVFEINCTILGFFFTQTHTKETLFKEAYNLCKENYKNQLCKTYIKSNSAIDHANATDQSILTFDKNSSASIDYTCLTKEILEKLSL
ncbi:sporulation initiation inhibitor Soj [Candidatus Marinamargulisbacteria bacterium SCGC AG-343-D04]|nr:sporulation initiation inhibitor Soj [Candidatus Marinamargulisbacteria bacterium SCGC AG-343-D04]